MCRHHVDLVGPSLLQRLSCCNKTVHVVDDVILEEERRRLKFGPEKVFFFKFNIEVSISSHHDDGDASSYITDHSDGGLLFGDQHWDDIQTIDVNLK